MTEIEKLHAKLTEQDVGHTYERRFPQMDKDFPDTDWGWQIWVHDDNFGGNWFAICGIFSHGYEKGLLQLMGDIVNTKDVDGYLTADDVMFRLYDYLSKKKEAKDEVSH